MAMGSSGPLGDGLTGRDRQREETKRRVREIALDAIRRDGLGDARIDEIARSAGVSRGTVYFHYPTKEHVVAELLAEAEARIGWAIGELPRTAPLRDVLDTFCAAFAREWEKEPELFPSVGAVAMRRAAGTIRSKPLDAVHRALVGRFRIAAERAELTDLMRPPVLADIFLVNVLAGTLAWSARPRLRLGTVLTGVIHVFLDGARPRADR
jgi:AcrR family transcriptional regulator